MPQTLRVSTGICQGVPTLKDVPSHPKFCFRLSPEERAVFEMSAKADGKKSLGTWLKMLARERVERQKRLASLE